MKARFSNACCKFRQRCKSHATVAGKAVEDTGWFDDTDYNPDFYRTLPNGEVEFSDWDDPGWEQTLPKMNTDNKEFGGTMYFVGYVIDTCDHNKYVGPSLFYGFIASGTPPNITILPYGFSQ